MLERRADGRIIVEAPLSEADVLGLRAGDRVRIQGVLYTARDAAHGRMRQLISEGKPLPFALKGQILYYVGPTPARPGRPIGSAGPTTSSRMDAYTPQLLELGLKGMIGKGYRGRAVLEAMQRFKAVYFMAIGGSGAVLAKRIDAAKVLAFEELGTEAIRELQVHDFPAVVANDAHGGEVFPVATLPWGEKASRVE